MNAWQTYLDAAVEAARMAGSYQRYRFASPLDVDMKGDKDLVTEVDRESERLIVSHLLGCFPDHGILAEEGDNLQGRSSFRWIIDPVDGTTNYAHGFPWFCSSIALEAEGELVAGVIYNPIYDELFTAVKGSGAFLNGRRLRVSDHAPLKDTLLGTGFPYDCASDPANNFDSFIAFQKKARGIRRAGAAALDLASVAAGRLDGYWELKLKPWDVAAGVLMVREAGGCVTTFDGSPFTVDNNRILASNGLIHDEMVALLALSAHGSAR
ncbi:inositol monophosphatase family protein [Geobacter sp. SVR]|uniref:inositol monophosphatase family protein n=1 Tax=Geobacter sp. SVR TaxID=2495594 RepID=UPI00143EF5B7|nr:inositol monophosphatase family protein [Geobacter sp. SVR]BCS52185.1 inositol monophosphatase [Geobacter sp. SVR]GCF85153.1 inositol monophosphatase [Geobacter sp. SVR]